jgi:hypothetical protein
MAIGNGSLSDGCRTLPRMSADTMPSYSFERVWSFAERTKGWLRREEGELLYRLSS